MSNKLNLLLAMPSMADNLFKKSVILLVEDDNKGSMGFAINILTGKCLKDVVSQIEPEKMVDFYNSPILVGGPIKTDFLWVIHDAEKKYASSLNIFGEVFLSAGQDIIPDILTSEAPEVLAMGVGYSGWSEGQLDDEISQGSWWKLEETDVDVFGTQTELIWDEAIKKIGIDLKNYVDEPENGMLN